MTKRAVEEEWTALVTFFREASTQVSATIRQLTLAGFAFAWLFKIDATPNRGWIIPKGIGWAMGLLLASLFLDLCQYAITVFWIDKVLDKGESPKIPSGQLVVMHVLWWAKVVAAMIGYLLLIITGFNELTF